jgi:hypothetical protein
MANELIKVGNVATPAATRVLTPVQYGDLAEVPPELEWLANITNPKNPRGLPDRCPRIQHLRWPARAC